uniref:Phytocyanin domain-containing protein n=1 Tax=Oryza nivara TaxID=4536 RepID=A0A0E0H764_ORYNI
MAGAVATVSVGLAWLGLMAAAASATQFRVGGGRGWSVPDANAEPYNSWAGRMRFQIGDQLLFVYPKETDAVVVVDQGAYDACNTSSSVAGGGGGRYDDGNTVFTFDRSGPFFFISGNEANCRAGEKLVVVVMADRGGRHAPPPSPPAVPPPVAPVPMPSPASSPPSPAPAAATPSLAPSPVATTPSPSPSVSPMAPAPAPTTSTPSSPPAPAAMAPSPSTTPGGVAQPPPPPGTDGANATTPAAPAANDRSGAAAAAPVVAGVVVTSLGAYIGYAMLAI